MFKFSSVNEYSVANLANNELYCNHYAAFNDPFECWCIQRKGFPDPAIEHERFLEVIAAWGFSRDLEWEARQDYTDYAFSLEDCEPSIEQTVNSARISCFCADGDNLLMWAHYGNGLRGFCIEFDENVILQNDEYEAHLLQVEYQSEPPVVDTAICAVADDQYWFHSEHADEPGFSEAADEARLLMGALYKKTLATKPIEWKYEKEIRLIFHTNLKTTNGCVYRYPEASIKSVILGEKMSEPDRSKVREILKAKNVTIPIKIARRAAGAYNVVIE